MTGNVPIKVFISYCHVPREHEEKCLALACRLQEDDGFHLLFDRFVKNGSPEQGWPLWMEDCIREADIVLVVATEEYQARFRRAGGGKGVKWEGAIITHHLYNSSTSTTRFIPVVFDPSDEPYIPIILQGQKFYDVSSTDEYDALCRRLNDVDEIVIPQIGTRRTFESRAVDKNVLHDAKSVAATGLPTANPQTQKTVSHNLPPRNRFFTGRDALFEKLEAAFAKGNTAALNQSAAAIHGFGGVGKTQMALEYAHRHLDRYTHVFWIDASQDPKTGLASAAATLNLPTANEAEPLSRRHLEIFLKFTRATGHEHPNLHTALENYAGLLSELGRSDQEIHDQLHTLANPYGIQVPPFDHP